MSMKKSRKGGKTLYRQVIEFPTYAYTVIRDSKGRFVKKTKINLSKSRKNYKPRVNVKRKIVTPTPPTPEIPIELTKMPTPKNYYYIVQGFIVRVNDIESYEEYIDSREELDYNREIGDPVDVSVSSMDLLTMYDVLRTAYKMMIKYGFEVVSVKTILIRKNVGRETELAADEEILRHYFNA